MANFTQLPGELNVVVCHVDGPLTITGSLGFSVVGDTLTALVYEDTATGYAAAIAATPAPAATWTVTVVTAATGEVSLSLSANAIKALSIAKSYRWFLKSASLGRAAVSGTFSVRAP